MKKRWDSIRDSLEDEAFPDMSRKETNVVRKKKGIAPESDAPLMQTTET